MSRTCSVTGYESGKETEKFKKFKAVWNACQAANIDVPDDVSEFFDYQDPNIFEFSVIDISNAVNENSDDNGDNWDVDLTKLPPCVKLIRFRID